MCEWLLRLQYSSKESFLEKFYQFLQPEFIPWRLCQTKGTPLCPASKSKCFWISSLGTCLSTHSFCKTSKWSKLRKRGLPQGCMFPWQYSYRNLIQLVQGPETVSLYKPKFLLKAKNKKALWFGHLVAKEKTRFLILFWLFLVSRS